MKRVIAKNKYIITLILVLIAIILVIYKKNNLKENNKNYLIDNVIEKENNNLKDGTSSKEDANKVLRVDIKGQVINPGVYEVANNTRVIDVINIAGGLTENANTSIINLSKMVTDEMVIIIYSNEEVANSNKKEIETVYKIIEKECNCPSIKNDSCINTELDNNNNKDDNFNNNQKDELININTANKEELMKISGIGESKANAIIEYRSKKSFNKIEDIINVSGISENLFNKIKEYIKV